MGYTKLFQRCKGQADNQAHFFHNLTFKMATEHEPWCVCSKFIMMTLFFSISNHLIVYGGG